MPEETNLPALSPSDLALMMEAGADKEKFSMRQTIVPYLGIVQGGSDYVKRGTPTYIEEARVGDLIDSLLRRPMSEAYVIPCKFEEHATEWEVKLGRDGKRERGKLVRQWFTDHSKYEASQKRGPNDAWGFPRITEEGNDINVVPTYYCLLWTPDSGSVRPVTLPLASTQAKKSRRWNGLIDALEVPGPNGMIDAPIYAAIYKLSTTSEGDGDNTWMGYIIEPYALTLTAKNGRGAWKRAQGVRKSVEAGEMRMAPPVAEPEPEGDTDAAERAAAQRVRSRGQNDEPPPPNPDDIPF